MLLNNWNNVLQTSFQNLWSGVINFLPNLLVAIIIFVLGWVVGVVLGQWVARIIKSLQVDKALKSIGAEEVLEKAGFRLDPGAFIGGRRAKSTGRDGDFHVEHFPGGKWEV